MEQASYSWMGRFWRTVAALALVLSTLPLSVIAPPAAAPPPAEAGDLQWTDARPPLTDILDTTAPFSALPVFGNVEHHLQVASNGHLFTVGRDPADGTSSRVFRSEDGGRSWTSSTTAFCNTSNGIIGLQLSPRYDAASNPDASILALCSSFSTPLFLSRDRGLSFSSSSALASASAVPVSFAVAPDFDGNTMGTVLIGTTGNAGAHTEKLTWTASPSAWTAAAMPEGAGGAAPDSVLELAFSPGWPTDQTITRIYWDSGTRIEEQRLGGLAGTWPAVGAAETVQVASTAVVPTATDRAAIRVPSGATNADNYWLSMDLGGVGAPADVFRRTGGGTPSFVDTDLGGAGTNTRIRSLAAAGDFTTGTVFAGVGEPTPRIFKSTDGAQAWGTAVELHGGRGDIGAGSVRLSLSPGFAADSTLYASTAGDNGGVHVSRDGGAAWGDLGLTNEAFRQVRRVRVFQEGGVFKAFAVVTESPTTNKWAVFRTENYGPNASWARVDRHEKTSGSLRLAPGFPIPNVVYLARHTVTSQQVLKSVDGGPFTFTADPGPDLNTYIWVASDSVVFAGAANGKVWRTSNGGTSWAPATTTLGGAVLSIDTSGDFALPAGSTPQVGTVVAAARTAAGNMEAWISYDGGQTFAQVGSSGGAWGAGGSDVSVAARGPDTATGRYHIFATPTGATDNDLWRAVNIDPANPGTASWNRIGSPDAVKGSGYTSMRSSRVHTSVNGVPIGDAAAMTFLMGRGLGGGSANVIWRTYYPFSVNASTWSQKVLPSAPVPTTADTFITSSTSSSSFGRLITALESPSPASGTASRIYTWTDIASFLTPPTPTEPADGAAIARSGDSSQAVQLRWNPEALAAVYQFEVARDPQFQSRVSLFGDSVCPASAATGTFFASTDPLSPATASTTQPVSVHSLETGVPYYWHVRICAVNSGGVTTLHDGPWSIARSFKLSAATLVLQPSIAERGDQITITGTGFNPGEQSIRITLDSPSGWWLATVNANSAGGFQVTAAVPLAIGTGMHPVLAAGPQNSASAELTIPSPSNLEFNLSVSHGRPGTTVRATGSGFHPFTFVELKDAFTGTLISRAPASADGHLDTSFQVPLLDRGPRPIRVLQDGASVAEVPFLVTPFIAGSDPTFGPNGSVVTIHGADFGPDPGTGNRGTAANRVRLDGVSTVSDSLVLSWANDRIVFTVPSATPSSGVAVQAMGGGLTVEAGDIVSNRVCFRVASGDGPCIDAGNPSPSTRPGFSRTINGERFLPGETVNLWMDGGDPNAPLATATPGGQGKFSKSIRVPLEAPLGLHVVHASAASGSADTRLALGPASTCITPVSGNPGAQVTINGKDFGSVQGSGSVSFTRDEHGNSRNAKVLAWSDTQIMVEVPFDAITDKVSVSAGGVFRSDLPFVVGGTAPEGPAVTCLTATTDGAGVTTLTVAGRSFGSDPGAGGRSTSTNRVSMGSFSTVPEANVVSWNDGEIKVTVPATATNGFVSVTAGGIASNSVPYEVTPSTGGAPQLSVSPDNGPSYLANNNVQVQVTVSGSHFVPGQQVTLHFDRSSSSTLTTVTVGSDGTFTSAPLSLSKTTTPGRRSFDARVFGNRVQLATFKVTPFVERVCNINLGTPVCTDASNPSRSFGLAGDNVQVTGLGFGPDPGEGNRGTRINRIESPAGSFAATTWSDTEITFTAPSLGSPALSMPVRVKAKSVLSNAFCFRAAASDGPCAFTFGGRPGMPRTVTGDRFSPGQVATLTWDSGSAPLATSPAEVQADVEGRFSATLHIPADAAVGHHSLVARTGGPAVDQSRAPVDPALTCMTPATGPASTATAVTLKGRGFGAVKGTLGTVNFQGSNNLPSSGTVATAGDWSDTQVVASSPTNVASGFVTVGAESSSTTTQPFSNTIYFTTTGTGGSPITTPHITCVNPDGGAKDTAVTVTGVNLGSVSAGSRASSTNRVTIGGVTVPDANVTAWTSSSIVFKMPEGFESGFLAVRAGGVDSLNSIPVVGNAGLTLELTATSGPAGSAVTAIVTGLSATPTLKFDGASTGSAGGTAPGCSFAGAACITFNVPSSALAGAHTVTVTGAVNEVLTAAFTVTVPLEITPSSASVTVGGHVLVSLKLNTGAQSVDGIQAVAHFDPAFLEAVLSDRDNPQALIGPGDCGVPVLKSEVSNATGRILVALGADNPATPQTFTGACTLGTVMLRGRQVTPAAGSPITWDAPFALLPALVTLGGIGLPMALRDGSVQVVTEGLVFPAGPPPGQPVRAGHSFAFGFQPRVEVRLNGAVRASPQATVTLGIKPGTGHPAGALLCDNANQSTTVNGTVQFSNCRIDLPGRYVLQATAAGLAPTDSVPFEVAWAGDASLPSEGADYCNVEVGDFSKLLVSFAKHRGETGFNSRTDFDGSDSTDIIDFSILLALFGTKCPTLSASISGTTLTVTGSNFKPSTPSVITYDGTALATPATGSLTPNGSGVLSATFTLASAPAGGSSHVVKATQLNGRIVGGFVAQAP